MSQTQPQTPDASPVVLSGETALRIGSGRHTVDIVPSDRGLLAIVGDGVGRPPATARIGPAVAAAVLELADTVDDERTAWQTAAWPLTC